jgi:hypothetical protein
VALIADPQLVDPHTYPGRPWPLSALTVKYTDLYIRRVFSLIQNQLYPDTTIFLGDLFDGGREWSTPHSASPEKIYQKYGDGFWQKEYTIFSIIFYDTWLKAGVAGRVGQPSRRRIVTSLPGNHDLGFASGIQEPVRKRFNAYFGDGNEIAIIGNHTMVSIDTVSLSARADGEVQQHIWKPAQDFLDNISISLKRTYSSHVEMLKGHHSRPQYEHQAIETEGLASDVLPERTMEQDPSYPTILLSHVPLYRDPGTPCGPFRERYPQSKDANGKPLEVDDRNAIAVRGGYQYQNVLSSEISKEIATKLENISYAFSGDDHDYCEVTHWRYPSAGGGIREITVKSISWAMGIRIPAIQMVSLWNPTGDVVVSKGMEKKSKTDDTLQTHMCLLPDQLHIFIRYACFFSVTLVLLMARASYIMWNPTMSATGGDSDPILPLSRAPAKSEMAKAESSSSDDGSAALLTSRSRSGLKSEYGQSRGTSPRPSVGYGLPAYEPNTPSPSMRSGGSAALGGWSDRYIKDKDVTRRRTNRGFALFRTELSHGLLRIIIVVIPFYLWLVWNG